MFKPDVSAGDAKRDIHAKNRARRIADLKMRAEFIKNRIDVSKIRSEKDLVWQFWLAFDKALFEKKIRVTPRTSFRKRFLDLIRSQT